MRLKYKKMILFATMGIMGIGMLSFSFDTPSKASSTLASSNKSAVASAVDENQKAATKTVTPGPTNPPTIPPTSTPIPEDPLKLKKDADPKINELIETYYQAKVSCDEDTLKSITTDASVIDIGRISREVEYIKNYHNITCYTKPGVAKGDYVVYAVFDMEIVSIETYAPSIVEFYVTTVDDKLYLLNGKVSDEITKLRLAYQSSDDVIELVDQVKKSLSDACASDESLNDFFKNVSSRISDDESEDTSSVDSEQTSGADSSAAPEKTSGKKSK